MTVQSTIVTHLLQSSDKHSFSRHKAANGKYSGDPEMRTTFLISSLPILAASLAKSVGVAPATRTLIPSAVLLLHFQLSVVIWSYNPHKIKTNVRSKFVKGSNTSDSISRNAESIGALY